jgi:hypothetical protein
MKVKARRGLDDKDKDRPLFDAVLGTTPAERARGWQAVQIGELGMIANLSARGYDVDEIVPMIAAYLDCWSSYDTALHEELLQHAGGAFRKAWKLAQGKAPPAFIGF